MKHLFSLVFSLVLLTNLSGQKVLLLEKFTNSHCGNCPNGALLLQDLVDQYDNLVWVSHYKPWDMVLNNDQSDQLWIDLGVYGNPLLSVDREFSNGLFHNMSSWPALVESELNEEQVATVSIKNLYTNAFERTIDFDCDISFLTDQENAEYRITAMVVEDLVTGEPQDNYYSNSPGHPLFGLGAEIWNYEHRNVVRHIFDDAWGTKDVLPTDPKAGDTATQHYQFSIPDDYNIDNMFIVCSITKYNPSDLSQIDVLQAAQQDLNAGVITSTSKLEEVREFHLHPNPTSDYFDLRTSKQVNEMRIVDASGKLMYSDNKLDLNTRVDISAFQSGFYIVQLRFDDQWISKPLSVIVTE